MSSTTSNFNVGVPADQRVEKYERRLQSLPVGTVFYMMCPIHYRQENGAIGTQAPRRAMIVTRQFTMDGKAFTGVLLLDASAKTFWDEGAPAPMSMGIAGERYGVMPSTEEQLKAIPSVVHLAEAIQWYTERNPLGGGERNYMIAMLNNYFVNVNA